MSRDVDGIVRALSEAMGGILRGTAVVYEPVYVPNEVGAQSVTYTPTGTVACNLFRARQGMDLVFAGALQSQTLWVVVLPLSTGISQDARLVIDGVTYEVVSHHSKRTDAICQRVLCNRVDV